jgi:outer membrane protein TolC
VPWAEDAAVAMAMKQRPELRSARHRVEQARGGKEIATAPYYPNVAGIATLTHSEGGGTFQPKDAWFVGLTLQWDVWEWGKTGAAVDEAAARLRQAQQGAVAVADGVAFDVRRRHIDARAALASLEAAGSGVAAAEEAHRIQSARYQQGAATTTDVLDAETDVARARSQLVLARYDYFLSLVALARAIGETPRPVP